MGDGEEEEEGAGRRRRGWVVHHYYYSTVYISAAISMPDTARPVSPILNMVVNTLHLLVRCSYVYTRVLYSMYTTNTFT